MTVAEIRNALLVAGKEAPVTVDVLTPSGHLYDLPIEYVSVTDHRAIIVVRRLV
jgi:cobalamin biosynthesis protein CbiD